MITYVWKIRKRIVSLRTVYMYILCGVLIANCQLAMVTLESLLLVFIIVHGMEKPKNFVNLELKITQMKLFFPYHSMKNVHYISHHLHFYWLTELKEIPKGKKVSAKMARGRGGGGSRDRGRRPFGRGGRKNTDDLARKRRQYQEFGEAHPVEEKDLNLKRRKARCLSFLK